MNVDPKIIDIFYDLAISIIGGIIGGIISGFLCIFLSDQINTRFFKRPRLIIRDLSFNVENDKSVIIHIDLFNEGKGTVSKYYYFMFGRKVFSIKDDTEDVVGSHSVPNCEDGWGECFNDKEIKKIMEYVKFTIIYCDFNKNWFYSECSVIKGKFEQGKQARLIKPIINWEKRKYLKSIE